MGHLPLSNIRSCRTRYSVGISCTLGQAALFLITLDPADGRQCCFCSPNF